MDMDAVLYCRISPRPDISDSLDRQALELGEFCRKHGWPIKNVFHDERISGSELNRPGLWKALSSLSKGDVLVVRDLSRFARDVAVALALESELLSKGCFLATYENGIVLDPTEDSLKYHDGVIVRFSKYWADARERLVKNARTSSVMKKHQADGRRMGGNCPIGWMVDPEDSSRLMKDPEEQLAIQYAVYLYEHEKKFSFREIARCLDIQHKSRRGESWRPQTVKDMIQRSQAEAS